MVLKKKKKAQSTICWKILLFDHFIIVEKGSEVTEKQDVKARDSYDLAPNLNPNWGREGARHNHDESEDQTIGSKKTQEDKPQKHTIYQFKENSLNIDANNKKNMHMPTICFN